jgi:quercetin dioxygenase-like cupin family protein
LSNVLHKDKYVNTTAFGFAAGQELSAHSALTPAALYSLSGEDEVRLGSDTVSARTGSFVYMPLLLTRGICAKSPVKILLMQFKAWANRASWKPSFCYTSFLRKQQSSFLEDMQ